MHNGDECNINNFFKLMLQDLLISSSVSIFMSIILVIYIYMHLRFRLILRKSPFTETILCPSFTFNYMELYNDVCHDLYHDT